MNRLHVFACCVRIAAAIVAAMLAAVPSRHALAAGAKLDPTGAFAIRWWTVEDGLPETPLTGVAVAPDGAVWCTGRTQVVRFDGREFRPLPETVAASLRHHLGLLRGVTFAPSGELWVYGNDGAARCESAARAIAGSVGDWTITPHQGGNLWHGFFDRAGRPHFYGMNLYLDFDGTRFVNRPLFPAEAPFTFYGAALERHSSALWVWGYGDARRIVGSAIEHAAEPLAGRISAMAAGEAGMWAGLVDLKAGTVDGVALFRDGQWREYPMPNKPSTATREGHVCEGPDGIVWLATHASMHALRHDAWQTVVDGLPDFSLTTQRLTADRTGSLWAACKGGLLSLGAATLQTTPLPPCRVLATRADGTIVAGIPGAMIPIDDGAAASARSGAARVELPAGVTPTAICETADGTLVVGTRDSFIYVVRDGKATVVTQTPGTPLEVRNVNALVRDVAGTVWAGTDNGLARYNPDRVCFDFVPEFITPAPAPVLGLLPDRDGSLLVAVQGRGIDRRAPSGHVTHEVPPALMPGKRIVQFARTPDRTLWAVGDQGLLRWDVNGQMALFDTRHGIVDRVIVQLTADERGRLWLAARDGHLQGIPLRDLDALAAGRRDVVRGVVLGPLDGLGEVELLGGLAHAGDRLLATTSAGLVRVDVENAAARAAAVAPAAVAVRQAASAGVVTFEWSEVTTSDFETPLYQSRLVGIDTAWSWPGHDTRRAYTAIPPGRHRFEVRRLRGDAIDTAPSGSIEITIPTPFWKTGWFLAGVYAVTAGLAAAIAAAVIRIRARRRIARLEQEQDRQRDRARIARDIHDCLGAGLTQMAMMSDLMRRSAGDAAVGAGGSLDAKLDEMYRSAQSLTRVVDEIVWAVNPANDTLRRFFSFVAHDVEHMARSGGLDLRIDVDDDVPDVVLAASSRHHLCMLVREAVANVLKHARATTLAFSLHARDGQLHMTIADDGQGFRRGAVSDSDQDGLVNMQVRVDELGGLLEIASAPGEGTQVEVWVPLAAAATPANATGKRPALRLHGGGRPDDDARRTG